jgi:hypothetical protein
VPIRHKVNIPAYSGTTTILLQIMFLFTTNFIRMHPNKVNIRTEFNQFVTLI